MPFGKYLGVLGIFRAQTAFRDTVPALPSTQRHSEVWIRGNTICSVTLKKWLATENSLIVGPILDLGYWLGSVY